MGAAVSNTSRPVCEGVHVDVCRPAPTDYPYLIGLRNRGDVRRWFVDDRVIAPSAGGEWLAARARRQDDVLLLIRHRARALNVGTIGWYDLDPVAGTAHFGRLVLDSSALRHLARQGEARVVLASLAVDACLAVRDHAFRQLGLRTLRTCYKRANRAAGAVNRACGMRNCAAPLGESDGLVHLELSRAEWEGMRRS